MKASPVSNSKPSRSRIEISSFVTVVQARIFAAVKEDPSGDALASGS